MRISYTASQPVLDIIGGLGRTEDIRFSSSLRRFAIAGFANNKIAVFDISIADPSGGRTLELTDAAEIFSTGVNHPHGLDFIDDETLIVANRDGDACVLKLPGGKIDRSRGPA